MEECFLLTLPSTTSASAQPWCFPFVAKHGVPCVMFLGICEYKYFFLHDNYFCVYVSYYLKQIPGKFLNISTLVMATSSNYSLPTQVYFYSHLEVPLFLLSVLGVFRNNKGRNNTQSF